MDEIVITLGLAEYHKLGRIVNMCEKSGVHTKFVPDYNNIIPTKPYTEDLMGMPVINIRRVPLNNMLNAVAKRCVDIFGALVAIILFSPVMLVTSIIIKVTSPGPLIFKQERIGKHNRPFYMYKFRSMVVQDEKDEKKGWTTKNDPRVTPIGRFIRKTSIDELPQLFNVLSGDMSLVGPRPERPEIIAEYQKEMPEFVFRTRVKAGVTGFAQIYGKYNTVPYDKLKLDLFYIENYSLWMDLKLILMTVKTVLKKDSTEGVDTDQTTGLKEHTEGNEEVERKIQEYTSREESHHE